MTGKSVSVRDQKKYRCPRCRHLIPNDDSPGAYPGALSRVDNATEICSVCGVDEALGNGPVPIADWPVTWHTTAYSIWKAGHQHGADDVPRT